MPDLQQCTIKAYNTAHTKIFRWQPAGFDKLKHTYLYTTRTHKGYKGIVVNQTLSCLHEWRVTLNYAYSPFKDQ